MKKLFVIVSFLLMFLLVFTSCNAADQADKAEKEKITEQDTESTVKSENFETKVTEKKKEYSLIFVPSLGENLNVKLPEGAKSESEFCTEEKISFSYANIEKANRPDKFKDISTAELKIGDIAYNATYVESFERTLLSNKKFGQFSGYDEYKGDNFIFNLNHKDGALSLFINYNAYEVRGGNLTEEKAISIADNQIAKLFGENAVKDYKRMTIRTNDTMRDTYSVYYVRTVHGIETQDAISVTINMQGQIGAVNANFFGLFANAENEITKEQIDNAIKAAEDRFLEDYTVNNKYLTIDSNGDYYVELYVTIASEDGETRPVVFYINVI